MFVFYFFYFYFLFFVAILKCFRARNNGVISGTVPG